MKSNKTAECIKDKNDDSNEIKNKILHKVYPRKIVLVAYQ